MAEINPYLDIYQGDVGGGSARTNMALATTSASIVTPTKETFDLSVLSGLRDTDRYLGKNRVSDIKEAYQTYLTDSKVGRGGQYAFDAAKRYGVSLADAARGYLLGAGINILPSTVQTQTTTQETVKQDNTVVTDKNPFQILADILPTLFGNAVYNPPLQSQAYGYTPTQTDQPLTQSSGGLNIGLLVIVGIIGVIGYFLYKRFAN
jgi:hypothetical protein